MEVGDISSPVTQYLQALKDEDQSANNYIKTDVRDENKINTLDKEAPSIDTVSQFLNNYGVRHAVLDTYGMKSMANATYLIKKLLTQDPDSSQSLAKTSNNAKWQSFADAFKAWGRGGGSVQTTPFTRSMVESVNAAYQGQEDQQVQQDVNTFSMQSMMIHSAKQLLAPQNSASLRVVLGAYDVSDLAQGANNADGSVNTKSVLYRLLSQPLDENSLAMRSGNAKWQALAGGFALWGRNGGQDAQMMTPKTINLIAGSYLQNTYQSDSSITKFASDVQLAASPSDASAVASDYHNFYHALSDPAAADPDGNRAFVASAYGMSESDVSRLIANAPLLSSLPQGAFQDGAASAQQLLTKLGTENSQLGSAVGSVYSGLGAAANQDKTSKSLNTAAKFFTALSNLSSSDAATRSDAHSTLTALSSDIDDLYKQNKVNGALEDVAQLRSGDSNIRDLGSLFKNSRVLGTVLSAYGISGDDARHLTSNLFKSDQQIDTSSHLYQLMTGHTAASDSAQEKSLASDFSQVLKSDGTLRDSSGTLFSGSDASSVGRKLEDKVEDRLVDAIQGDMSPDIQTAMTDDGVGKVGDLFNADGADAWKIVSTAFNLPDGDPNLEGALEGRGHQKSQLGTFLNHLASASDGGLSGTADWAGFAKDFAPWVSAQHAQPGTAMSRELAGEIVMRHVEASNPSDNAVKDVKTFTGEAGSLTSVSDLLRSGQARTVLRVMLGAAGVDSEKADALVQGSDGLFSSAGATSPNHDSDLYKMLTLSPNDSSSPFQSNYSSPLGSDEAGFYHNSSAFGAFKDMIAPWSKNGGRDIQLFQQPGFAASLGSDYQFRADLHASDAEQTFSSSASSLKTAGDLLSNASDMQMVQDKYGLDPQQDSDALFQILLTNDPDSKDSIAQQSGNKNWLQFAQDFRVWGKNNGGVGGSSPFLSDPVNTMLGEVKSHQTTGVQAAAEHFNANISHVQTVDDLIGSSQSDSGPKGDATTLRVILQAYGLGQEFKGAFNTRDGGNSFVQNWQGSSLQHNLRNLFEYSADDPHSNAHMMGANAVTFANDMHLMAQEHGAGQPLVNSTMAGKIVANFRSDGKNQTNLEAANVQSGFATLTNSDLLSSDVSDPHSLAYHPDVLRTLLRHFGLDNSDFGMGTNGANSLTDDNGVVRTSGDDTPWHKIVNLIATDPSSSDFPYVGTSPQERQDEQNFSAFFKNYRLAGRPQFTGSTRQELHDLTGQDVKTPAQLLSEQPGAPGNVSGDNLMRVLRYYNMVSRVPASDGGGLASDQAYPDQGKNDGQLPLTSDGKLTSQSYDLVKTLLTQNPDDPSSLVNQINRPNWKAFAKALESGGYSNAQALTFLSGLGHSVVSRYNASLGQQISGTINNFENAMSSVGSPTDFIQNPNLNSALYLYSVARGEPSVASLGQGALNADGSVNVSSNLYKLLTEDPTSGNSVAQMSQNSQWQDFAQFYKSMTQDPNDSQSFVHYSQTHPSDSSVNFWGKQAGQFAYGDSGSPGGKRTDMPAFSKGMADQLIVNFAAKSYDNLGSAVNNFEQTIGAATNAADLVSHPGAMNVIAQAYGMNAQQNERDITKMLLTQDPSSSSSLASRSGVATWKDFAGDMRAWGASGGSVNPSPFTPQRLHSIVSEYEKNQYENDKANTKDGVGNALYFTRKMGKVHNLYQLMSDQKLMNVVEEVNGLDPDDFGALDFDEQYRILSDKVDFKDFATPQKIRHYAERYLVMNQIHPQQQYEPETLMSLFGGDSDDDSILSLFGSGEDDNNNEALSVFGINPPGPKKRTI